MRSIRQIAALGVGVALVAAVGLYAGAAAPKATFTLVAGQTPANGGLNFNGADKGHLVLTVPVGAQVEITLVNKGDLPHSIQIIPFTKTLPGSAEPRPAFPGAETPHPQTGITKGQTAVARFTATTPGKYLLICGFPGHALLGMYGIFDVVPQASAKPSLTITK